MKIIGLCGGSGSGKGTVSSIFGEIGIPSVDADKIYHRITSDDSECLRALSVRFGSDIVGADGALDRHRLGKIVFTGDGAERNREDLNRISHKYVLEEIRAECEQHRKKGAEAVVVDAPLLFESGYHRECDTVIAVIADRDIRIRRIVSRDKITTEAAEARINAQLSDKYLRENSQFTIVNDGGLDTLRERVFEIAEKILNKN